MVPKTVNETTDNEIKMAVVGGGQGIIYSIV